jgi:hypothetical protein
MQQQSIYLQMTSCLKYLASSLGFQVAIVLAATPYGNGTDSCMSVEDGDKSYFHHHSVSTCNFSALIEHLYGNVWVAGQPSLLSLTMAISGTKILLLRMSLTFLLHSSNAIVCAISISAYQTYSWKSCLQSWRSHFWH